MFLKYILTAIVMTFTYANTDNCPILQYSSSNQCIQFSVSSGTGCAWMCQYCETQLDTTNYFFMDNVCTYNTGVGCVGNPIAGKMYTCCSL